MDLVVLKYPAIEGPDIGAPVGAPGRRVTRNCVGRAWAKQWALGVVVRPLHLVRPGR